VVHGRRWGTARRRVDYSRQEKRRPQSPLEEAPEPSASPNNADPLLSDMLRDLVAALPENARVVMILRYQEDLDPMDIAQALDMPIATVKSHLQRSLALLRDKLSRTKGVGL
jgi:RNA polymerase sigma-70 factor, ECF subfamily